MRTACEQNANIQIRLGVAVQSFRHDNDDIPKRRFSLMVVDLLKQLIINITNHQK